MTAKEKEAKAALETAIREHADACHEAGYYNGFRVAAGDTPERHKREMTWWRQVSERSLEVDKALREYARAVRAGAKS